MTVYAPTDKARRRPRPVTPLLVTTRRRVRELGIAGRFRAVLAHVEAE